MTDPTSQPLNSYDAVPYPSTPYRGTHPDTLATLGTLVGMKPAPIDSCRVLELGCSDGGNLLPMAYSLPGSEFVGIDGSARQIELGLATLEALGLKNVTLKQMNLLDVGDQFGKFDYIIAHGIYSWVPPDVQDKILEICHCLLKPQGLAFVSYNTLPGWRTLSVILGASCTRKRVSLPT